MALVNPMNPGTQAVILSGGGAYAAYEIGAMKALFSGESAGTGYTPVDPEIFTGTSAGAFNAAFMSSQPGVENLTMVELLERVWLDKMADSPETCGNKVIRFRGSPLNLFKPACLASDPIRPLVELAQDTRFFAQDLFERGVEFVLSAGQIEKRLLDLIDLSAFATNKPFIDVIKENIQLDGIRRSDKLMRIAATNWQDGEVKIFSNEDMSEGIGHEAITASTSLPGIFRPVEIAGVPYVDGGLVMNTPLLPAIEAGADTLHIIYLDPDVSNIPVQRLQHTLDTFDRMRNIEFALRINLDVQKAREINLGLRVLNQGAEADSRGAKTETLSNAEQRAFIRSVGVIQKSLERGVLYRTLTIHRYHPQDELGGALGMLSFDREAIQKFINRGFSDVSEHNCFASECTAPMLDYF